MKKLIIGVWIGALALTAALFLVTQPAKAVILDATTKSIELVTTTTAPIDYLANWADHTSSAFTPGNSSGEITTATTTTIVSAPAASTQRQLKGLTVRNTSTTASNTVTIQLDVSGTNIEVYKRVLGPEESFDLDANSHVTPFDKVGRAIVAETQPFNLTGQVYSYMKAGGAKDAGGYWYSTWKDAGFPGAFSLQTPGLNGFTTDCSIASQTTDPNGAAQIGAHPLPDPSSGSLWLRSVGLSDSVAEMMQLIDVVWYNTGIVVTTTTAQNITMPTLPSRDANGTNNGEGWQAALYTTTANTNAGTISNTTISYTDQAGNAGNTGTFSAVVGWQAPATPVIGTWMPFQLAAGDTGIRSIQSVTLGTSYAGGALSLVLYRVLASIPVQAGSNTTLVDLGNPGVKIYPNTCIVALQVGNASAGNISGSYTIVER